MEIARIRSSLFDFTEISKRALGSNWKKFAEDQKIEFADLFAQILENSYLKKIQGDYQDETVVYLNQKMIANDKALVRTHILRQSVKISIDYSMQSKTGAWRIYDVSVEGVSLISNYRHQFNDILLKESPSQLIARLKSKSESTN